ncbi:MAG TPA: mycofactocin biosynthesis chaperone MftB [Acidimicrobiales bacterium]
MTGPPAFDPGRPWRLHPRVALREEPFGALAYHYDNRRLVFLKAPRLVELLRALERFETAGEAVAAVVDPGARSGYEQALSRLAAAQVIDVR